MIWLKYVRTCYSLKQNYLAFIVHPIKSLLQKGTANPFLSFVEISGELIIVSSLTQFTISAWKVFLFTTVVDPLTLSLISTHKISRLICAIFLKEVVQRY